MNLVIQIKTLMIRNKFSMVLKYYIYDILIIKHKELDKYRTMLNYLFALTF